MEDWEDDNDKPNKDITLTDLIREWFEATDASFKFNTT